MKRPRIIVVGAGPVGVEAGLAYSAVLESKMESGTLSRKREIDQVF